MSELVELRIVFDVKGAAPREVRRRFCEALREAIAQAYFDGQKIDAAVSEELWRVVPQPEAE